MICCHIVQYLKLGNVLLKDEKIMCNFLCIFLFMLVPFLHSTTLVINNLVNGTIVQCIFIVKICAILEYLIVMKIHSEVKLNVLTCH